MIRRRNLRGERIELYSPIGLLPKDAFTSLAPIGRIIALLDQLGADGKWRATGISEVVTPGGVIAYPGLGRSTVVAGQPSITYRVRIEAEFYEPLYRRTKDGIEFTAFPYNDTNPPQNAVDLASAQIVMLAPAPNYPFPDHIRVLRGVVVDQTTQEPVVSAEVVWGNKETTLTTGPSSNGDRDKKSVLTVVKGAFALPLRITKKEHTTEDQDIDAFDHRTKREGKIQVKIPADLGKNKIIPIKQPRG